MEVPEEISVKLNKHLLDEEKSLTTFIHKILEQRNHISCIDKREVNKLEILLMAKKIGLNIPSTLVCTEIEDVLGFLDVHPRIVTKSIQETVLFPPIKREGKQTKQYRMLTSEIKKSHLKNVPRKFLPTKLQNKIEKAVELRIFVLKDKFYPMTIFSQGNKKTETDFRNYDWQRPNRNVPFSLPIEIQRKLTLLMKKSGLNSGSIDMILDKNGDYIFLEINPIGQFGMVSFPCNYYLEQEIAKQLSK